MNLHTAALIVAFTVVGSNADDHDTIKMYRADMAELGNSGVTGIGAVMVMSDTELVFGATARGLPNNVDATACAGAVNCGVHIHAGTSCDDFGGFYVANASANNPWLSPKLKYTTSSSGVGTAGGLVETGVTSTLKGRPFMFHGLDGAPIACGMLQPVSTSIQEMKVLSADTRELGGSGVEGEVVLVMPANSAAGEVCIFGSVTGLETGLLSTHNGGDNCTAVNGCGTHVHSGSSCENSTTQGGHFYDTNNLLVDPWLVIGYPATTSSGQSAFAHCVMAGISNWAEYDGKPFIIHSNDGSRKSCGILKVSEEDSSPSSGATAHATTGILFLALKASIYMAAALF